VVGADGLCAPLQLHARPAPHIRCRRRPPAAAKRGAPWSHTPMERPTPPAGQLSFPWVEPTNKQLLAAPLKPHKPALTRTIRVRCSVVLLLVKLTSTRNFVVVQLPRLILKSQLLRIYLCSCDTPTRERPEMEGGDVPWISFRCWPCYDYEAVRTRERRPDTGYPPALRRFFMHTVIRKTNRKKRIKGHQMVTTGKLNFAIYLF
jgi:hypothetical protein